MKQNIWFGLRVTMLAAIIGSASSTQAQQSLLTLPVQGHANSQMSTNIKSSVTIAQVSHALAPETPSHQGMPSGNKLENKPENKPENQTETLKVGTRYIPGAAPNVDVVLAKVQAHEWANRRSAILYVRNIPVLTFLGDRVSQAETVKIGVTAPPASKELQAQPNKLTLPALAGTLKSPAAVAPSSEADDPVSLATQVAAQINQLTQSNQPIGDITVHWVKQTAQAAAVPQSGHYEVRVAGKPLVILNQRVVLAGQTQQNEANALQAANRLRRLIANAAPLTAVADKPQVPVQAGVQQVALGPVRFSLNGVASWYGPGFHGNLSANGEVYNQYALTAAHKTLPFGTKVKVTNLSNGRSVVVRINDRGPYVGNRIIDLSLGAAEVIGMMSSGTASVQVDVLN